ncbi:MAG TPA: hypothetical protein VMF91_26885 [Bryobacteraceae bacterium]|nr:hypothetical protein [Bryobacteraceae bacterium]
MNYVEQEIVLRTEAFYGGDIPLALSSPLLRRLENTARPSVRMVLEGTSASVGAPPAWLERASDIRTLGFSARDGDSILHLKAPKLGDAAPRLFEQQSLWPGNASPEDTAIQVIGRISEAVRQQEAGSDLYDRYLLKRITNWNGLFRHGLKSVDFRLGVAASDLLSALDEQVIANAQLLSDQTPSPRQVRIVGKLDMVRHSTRSFGLILDGGEEIRGVLIDGTSEMLQDYFGKDITVLGKAIYRPSGTLLRIDASEILPAVEGRQAFSKVPPSLTLRRRPERRLQASKGGVASFFGSWPGKETDRELLQALEDVRS